MLKRLNEKLQGSPDNVISLLLITLGIGNILLGMFGNRIAKLFILVWELAP